MAVEDPQHLALGIGALMRRGVVDARENAPRLPLVCGKFHRDNPLPHRRQHFLNRKFIGDATGEANALKPGARHDQRVRRPDLAAIGKPLHCQIVELAHAGVGGAAIVNHLDFRKQPARIGRAPHGVGADLETLAARVPEIVDRNPSPQHQNVAGPITSPGVSSLPGMSFSECMAACNSPEITALRISATNAPPLPPCCNSLPVWSVSPVVSNLTISTSISGAAAVRRRAISSVCASAMALLRVPIRIRIATTYAPFEATGLAANLRPEDRATPCRKANACSGAAGVTAHPARSCQRLFQRS